MQIMKERIRDVEDHFNTRSERSTIQKGNDWEFLQN